MIAGTISRRPISSSYSGFPGCPIHCFMRHQLLRPLTRHGKLLRSVPCSALPFIWRAGPLPGWGQPMPDFGYSSRPAGRAAGDWHVIAGMISAASASKSTFSCLRPRSPRPRSASGRRPPCCWCSSRARKRWSPTPITARNAPSPPCSRIPRAPRWKSCRTARPGKCRWRIWCPA